MSESNTWVGDRRLLTSQELAAESGVSYGLLQRWMQKGLIVPDLVETGHQGHRGRRYFWTEQWVDECRDLFERMEACPYDHGHYDYT